ncbi:hypothetical protein DACRYDRAFT_118642 [Dacryopinax primogenitus]|uniref:DUF1772-domain-containing protein n=1 Tax=Dacryopinax primogenitus (strain DJM 731) TaxID=1858805 RepID=M5FRL0_DACPD|nr:uncharacterized protein DACRYDRAFT_118642 [Dacryopinax primogenitus]EJT98343.1 hypothetical protein DACRYDRAFT_118642 [Dacryopinax primogenitus]
MSSNDTFNKLITVLAVSGSAYLAGFTSSITFLTVPILPLSGPRLATRQWAGVYDRGSRLGPPMGLVFLSLFAYAAWANGVLERSPKGVTLAVAGLCAAANMPWILMAMLPTNSELLALAAEPEPKEGGRVGEKDEKRKREEVDRLISKWGWLNAVRSVGLTLGALIGGAAAVELL